MAEAFALLLRRHRHRLRLTQEQLAERAGISARSLRELERGRTPRPHTVARLAEALGLREDAREDARGDARGAAREDARGAAREDAGGDARENARGDAGGDARGDKAENESEHTVFIRTGRAMHWASRVGTLPPAGPGVNQLPPDLPDFVGRDVELAVLEKALAPASQPARLVAVSGPPGVGKTALTVYAAHRFANGFPDGILFAALRGASGDPADPADVLADLLRAVGVDGAALPTAVDARAALFRSRVSGRRILLVLDDAGGHRQVEPLLAGAAAVLVSSRTPLTGLPGVTHLDLDPLPAPDALALLGRVAGETRVEAEPAAATALVAACGCLPLAVRIAAARLAARPQWSVDGLAARLADEHRRLDELRHGDLTVRSGLELAHGGLSSPAARAFALLGSLGVRSVPEWSIAPLLDCGRADAEVALDELVEARLLDDLGPDAAGQVRYGFHDLTRLYARERAAAFDPADLVAALARAAAGWLVLLRRAQDRLECERFHLDDRRIPEIGTEIGTVPDPSAATERPLAWFAAERDAIVVLVTACADAGLAAHARALAGAATDFYELCAHYDDWNRVTRAALAACRAAGDREGAAAMLRGLGGSLIEIAPEQSLEPLREAREQALACGDEAGAAMAGKDLAFGLGLTGRLAEAERQARSAATALARVGRYSTRVMVLGTVGMVQRQRGDYAGAVRTYRSGVSSARVCGDRFALAFSLRGLSGALLAAGEPAAAERAAGRAASLFADLGDQIGRAQSLRAVGEALSRDPNRTQAAERALRDAAGIFADRGYEWGAALTELSLSELVIRHGFQGTAGGTDLPGRLRRTLRYWLAENVPALQARTLVALAALAEHDGDPAAPDLLRAAHHLYVELAAPEAVALGERLGLPAPGPPPDIAALAGER